MSLSKLWNKVKHSSGMPNSLDVIASSLCGTLLPRYDPAVSELEEALLFRGLSHSCGGPREPLSTAAKVAGPSGHMWLDGISASCRPSCPLGQLYFSVTGGGGRYGATCTGVPVIHAGGLCDPRPRGGHVERAPRGRWSDWCLHSSQASACTGGDEVGGSCTALGEEGNT